MSYTPQKLDLSDLDNYKGKPIVDSAPVSRGTIGANGIQQAYENAQNPRWPERAAGDVVAGLAQMGHGLINAPHNIVNQFSPSLASHIPQQEDFDYGKALGVNKPNIIDQLIQGAGQYAPYELGGEASLAAKGLSNAAKLSKARLLTHAGTGATFGATQFKDPLKSAVEGAVINAAIGPAGALIEKGVKGIGAIPDAIRGFLAKHAAPGMVEKIDQSLSPTKNIDNNTAAQMIKEHYGQVEKVEKEAWNKVNKVVPETDVSLTKKAKKSLPKSNKFLDSTSPSSVKNTEGEWIRNGKVINAPITPKTETPKTFDNSQYKKALKEEIDRLTQQSEQSGHERNNEDAIKYLKGYLKDPHSTFERAFEHNKSLNKDYANEVVPGKSAPFSAINYAKEHLKNAIEKNIKDKGLSDTVGKEWKNANQITAQKNKVFNEVTSNQGNNIGSAFSKILKSKSEYVDPTPLVKQYVPTTASDGIQKMQQFAKMTGNEDAAKTILKKNIFESTLEKPGETLDPHSFMRKFNSLSEVQQKYLFGNHHPMISALSKIMDKHPDLFKEHVPPLVKNFIAMTIGAAAGHGVLPMGDFIGTGLGYGAYKVGKNALAKALSSPKRIEKAVEYTNKPKSQPKEMGAIANAIKKYGSSGLSAALQKNVQDK